MLDGSDPNAMFVFLIGTTLTTAPGAVVTLLDASADDAVYWHVGSSATLDTSTLFVGNVIADQSVTLNTTARILCGRAIALNAAVTMDTNVVDNTCGAAGPGVGTVPEPGSLALVLAALGLGCAGRRAWRQPAFAG